jgi:taurine dioxygenase
VSITRVGVFCGAEVTGVDLTRPLDAAIVETIKAAHAEHGVLAFPDQDLTSDQLVAFGRQMGELTVHPFSTNDAETPELIVYDNKEGNPPPPTDVWHSDEMFRECPPMGTILCSKIVPSPGGDTAFCSMAALYEGLSDRMQNHLSGLEAVHDFAPFKDLFMSTEEGRESLRRFEKIYPPSTHPVVRVHPVTGRKVIYVSRAFTQRIKDMDEEEGALLLDFLYQRTLCHEYHYRHHWRLNTVVFWDNRSVQHSALHDYYPRRRMLERVTVRGDRPVGDAPPPDRAELRRDLSPPLSEFGATRAQRQND